MYYIPAMIVFWMLIKFIEELPRAVRDQIREECAKNKGDQ